MTYPDGYEPQSELILKKWCMRIEQSPNEVMLREIGMLIAKESLPSDDMSILRDLYAARLSELRRLRS